MAALTLPIVTTGGAELALAPQGQFLGGTPRNSRPAVLLYGPVPWRNWPWGDPGGMLVLLFHWRGGGEIEGI